MLKIKKCDYWYGLSWLVDAQWNDEAIFTCVTEDDEKTATKLTVKVAEKKPKKVEKKVEVKKVEFDDKKSYALVDSLFEQKVCI